MKDKKHILIVDDDNRILKLLKQFLTRANFLVSTSTSTDEALKLLEYFNYDLIILDVMMPEITGVEFAIQLRKSGTTMPIIMLTALSEPGDRIQGLESGANDYLTKPFEPKELLLRINNLINSYSLFKQEQKIIRFGKNTYNLGTKELKQDNSTIKLSPSEENLLSILINKSNEIIYRTDLSEKLGGLNLRSVDVQVVRLRNKIETNPKVPQHLKTIRNQGYVLYL